MMVGRRQVGKRKGGGGEGGGELTSAQEKWTGLRRSDQPKCRVPTLSQ